MTSKCRGRRVILLGITKEAEPEGSIVQADIRQLPVTNAKRLVGV